MCIQAEQEPLRDYLNRWTELHNSYEGVHEVRAIKYFVKGYRARTLLKHKLVCLEPTRLAELMAKGDKYATTDSAMWIKVTATGKAAVPLATPKPAADVRGQENNKRKADHTNPRYGSKKVATMEEEQPATQATSQRQRDGKAAWQPKLTFDQMLDAPYKMHIGAKPVTHTLRQCCFSEQLARGFHEPQGCRLPEKTFVWRLAKLSDPRVAPVLEHFSRNISAKKLTGGKIVKKFLVQRLGHL
ncbi:Endoglucanase 3 [Hordeum vulgare]|nr:Endoglucanase 3 [Hordeum vulgare]